ncbi:hypothetical protein Tco_0466498 [Tanacetum coccineum]
MTGNIDVRSLVSSVYKKQTVMDFHNSKLHMASVEEEFSGMPAFNGFSHFDPHVADESPYTMPSVRADLSGIATNLYYAKTVPYTVWADRCERFFRQSGSVASTGECSSRGFKRNNKQIVIVHY